MTKFLSFLTLLLFFLPNVNARNYLVDCEVILYETNCTVSGKTLTENIKIVLQINNLQGQKYAEIAIPFSKNLKLSKLEAWIEDANGNKIRQLKRSEITERSAISDISLYEDNFVKTFELKNPTFPYRICYSYTQTSSAFHFIANWSPVIFSKVPTHVATLSVTYPQDFKVKSFQRGVEETKNEKQNDLVTEEFTGSYLNTDLQQVYGACFDELIPMVKIIPLHFNYGIEGFSDNWQNFGNWFLKLNSGLSALPQTEKLQVDNLINGISDKREIVKKLYRYLQDHTRYINVSIGFGGFKSYPADFVAEKKYGDCKSLTNYMKSLLAYAGIESYFALVNSGTQQEAVIEDMPCPQFNHIILAVPLEIDTIWIENTSNTIPLGYTGTWLQGRKALLLDEAKSKLVDLPKLSIHDVATERTMSVEVNTAGNAKTQVKTIYRGYNYEMFDELSNSFTKSEQERFVKDYMPFVNYEVLNWQIKKRSRDTANIELLTELNLYKFAKNLGSELYFNPLSLGVQEFETVAERKQDVVIRYPIFKTDSCTYSVQNGLSFKTVPPPIQINSKYGSFTVSSKLNGNTLEVVKQFKLLPATIPLKEYAEFYVFITSARNADKNVVVLKK
jgi:transglutaminase-like putative cysteine protease